MSNTPVPLQNAFQRFIIDPQTSWDRFFNPQFFVTYNAPDVAVENHVLSRVGSYGSQLSTVLDVLSVLVAQLPATGLTPEERRSVDRFVALRDGAQQAVAEVRGSGGSGVTMGDVDRMVDDLASLAKTDPIAHDRLVGRLRAALDPVP